MPSHSDVVPLTRATHGQGSGMIVEEITCNGAESQLVDCSVRDQRDGECSHREDAGVICGEACACIPQLTMLVIVNSSH